MDADKIVWTESSIKELKEHLHKPDPVDDFVGSVELTYPWPMTVANERLTYSDEGTRAAQVTIAFDPKDLSDDYEIRVVPVNEAGVEIEPPVVGIHAVTTYNVNNSILDITDPSTDASDATSTEIPAGLLAYKYVVTVNLIPAGYKYYDVTMRITSADANTFYYGVYPYPTWGDPHPDPVVRYFDSVTGGAGIKEAIAEVKFYELYVVDALTDKFFIYSYSELPWSLIDISVTPKPDPPYIAPGGGGGD